MYIIAAVIAEVLLIGLDQYTKHLAVRHLKDAPSITVINGIFDLAYVENVGAAFGIMEGARWLFLILASVVLVAVAVYYVKIPRHSPYNWVRISLVMISAGAAGNAIDRFRQGYVVDFFYARFINFPVFNVADILIVTGTILFSVLLLFFVRETE